VVSIPKQCSDCIAAEDTLGCQTYVSYRKTKGHLNNCASTYFEATLCGTCNTSDHGFGDPNGHHYQSVSIFMMARHNGSQSPCPWQCNWPENVPTQMPPTPSLAEIIFESHFQVCG
jgi:hypothetical protein